MARSRNIKPSFFTNELLAEISPLGRLLFAGLWCFADKEGRLEDRPKRIKTEILPYDNSNIEMLLADLEANKFISRYEINSEKYIQIVNFNKHQNPHPKESDSHIPPMPLNYTASTGNSGTSRADSLLSFPSDSLQSDSLFCSNGKKPSEPTPIPEKLAQTMPLLKRVRLDDPGALFSAWSQAFPDVDIFKEILACDAWGVSNRVTRSAKGWAKTLNYWLSKEQDKTKGGKNANGPRSFGAEDRVVGDAKPVSGKYAHLFDSESASKNSGKN